MLKSANMQSLAALPSSLLPLPPLLRPSLSLSGPRGGLHIPAGQPTWVLGFTGV